MEATSKSARYGHTMATIDEVFEQFLAEQRARLSDRTYYRYREVIELFAMSMNSYGPNGLEDDEYERYEQASKADDEATFTKLFGPEKIAENLGEFLGYFMVSKVMAGQELLKAAGTVTKKLSTWLVDNDYTDETSAAVMADQAADAAVDLPAAERLADALYDETKRVPAFDPDSLSDDDWLVDFLQIERVDPGFIRFAGVDEPLEVSPATSALAQPGWMVYVEMVRHGRHWRLVEVGNVYP